MVLLLMVVVPLTILSLVKALVVVVEVLTVSLATLLVATGQ